MKDRKQFTTIHNINSELKEIDCGIPQGSALGPLLFLIYINDLPNALKPSQPTLFADDCNIFMFNKNTNDLLAEARLVLSNLIEWSKVNKLTINFSKTSYMLLHCDRTRIDWE